jgi:hypothetical protein
VPARQRSAEQRLQPADDVEQAHAITAANVEHAGGFGRLGGPAVGVHDVVDVGEVARLVAVAVDLERLPGECPQDEARDHRRVLRGRVLPRAEDVEVAQAHRLHAVQALPHRRVLLAGRLGHRVGRDRSRRLILALG